MDPRAIALPDGALTTEAEADRATVSAIKQVGLKFAMLPSEALHTLQYGVITELQAREQRTLNVISEQKVNNIQLATQKNSIIDLLKATTEKNEHMTKVVVEACKTVPELDIPKYAPLDVRIRKLAAGVHEARTKLTKVQFELNLKIAELELRA